MLEELIDLRLRLDRIIKTLTEDPSKQTVPDGLTPIERTVFMTLASRPGQWVETKDLMRACESARNRDGEFTAQSLWVHVHRLRRKLKNVQIISGYGNSGYMIREGKG